MGGLKKAVNALLLFLGFSCNPEFDFDFFDLCCFCFFDFVGGKVVSSSPNLDNGFATSEWTKNIDVCFPRYMKKN